MIKKPTAIRTGGLLKIGAVTIATAIVFSLGACSSTSDKHSENGRSVSHAGAKSDKGAEVTPKSLETGLSSPISAEDSGGTALSRPKIVKVQEIDNPKSGRKYFDVVDDRAHKDKPLAPLVDKSVRAIRITMFDNNSIQKDYPMRFGIVWERALESFLELPLHAVDRSSGIIITDWITDTDRASAKDFLSLRIFGAKDKIVRYKYTVRIIDRGDITQIKVIPFTQVTKGKNWITAKPGLSVAEAMFRRIESELSTPVPSKRN